MSPEEKRAEAILAAVEISRFSGPLPHPEDLAKYEQVLPGAADRIISMAEQQAAHRQAEGCYLLERHNSEVGPWQRVCSGNDRYWWWNLVVAGGYERSRTDRDNFRIGSSGRRFCLR